MKKMEEKQNLMIQIFLELRAQLNNLFTHKPFIYLIKFEVSLHVIFNLWPCIARTQKLKTHEWTKFWIA